MWIFVLRLHLLHLSLKDGLDRIGNPAECDILLYLHLLLTKWKIWLHCMKIGYIEFICITVRMVPMLHREASGPVPTLDQ